MRSEKGFMWVQYTMFIALHKGNCLQNWIQTLTGIGRVFIRALHLIVVFTIHEDYETIWVYNYGACLMA